jgi:2'-phosphotransferase
MASESSQTVPIGSMQQDSGDKKRNKNSRSGKPKYSSQKSEQEGGRANRGRGGESSKLRGMDKDLPEVRLSKTLSWILRHGATAEGLPIRDDGFIRVDDIVCYVSLPIS